MTQMSGVSSSSNVDLVQNLNISEKNSAQGMFGGMSVKSLAEGFNKFVSGLVDIAANVINGLTSWTVSKGDASKEDARANRIQQAVNQEVSVMYKEWQESKASKETWEGQSQGKLPPRPSDIPEHEIWEDIKF